MLEVWIYSLISVIIVSIISLVGVIALFFSSKKIERIVLYLVAFSAGALFGGAFIHLIPEVIYETGYNLGISFFVLIGIVLFFILEKFIQWRHIHFFNLSKKIKSFAFMNLVGDGIHNFIDGLIIGAAYLINIPLGITTTLAVIFHEIPQEIGDFGVLVHGGFSKKKALLVNFLSALTSLIGVISALLVSGVVKGIELFLVPIAAGGFIYIAGSDLIPELHKKISLKKSFWQLIAFILGISVMGFLLLLEI